MDHGAEEVKNANLRFYEAAAPHYDAVDPRRTKEKLPWLEDILRRLRASLPSDAAEPALLDAGAGSGFLLRHAGGIFPRRIALDLSPRMLEKIQESGVERLTGSCEKIPLEDASVHVAAAFAVLHHLHDPILFFSEAYRVLRPGGAVYTDHDLAAPFARRFRWPLRAWRYFFDHGPEYLRRMPEVAKSDYHLSEYHGESGLDGEAWRGRLESIGFRNVSVEWHWQGGGAPERLLTVLGLEKAFRSRGLAPFLRITAWKR